MLTCVWTWNKPAEAAFIRPVAGAAFNILSTTLGQSIGSFLSISDFIHWSVGPLSKTQKGSHSASGSVRAAAGGNWSLGRQVTKRWNSDGWISDRQGPQTPECLLFPLCLYRLPLPSLSGPWYGVSGCRESHTAANVVLCLSCGNIPLYWAF